MKDSLQKRLMDVLDRYDLYITTRINAESMDDFEELAQANDEMDIVDDLKDTFFDFVEEIIDKERG